MAQWNLPLPTPLLDGESVAKYTYRKDLTKADIFPLNPEIQIANIDKFNTMLSNSDIIITNCYNQCVGYYFNNRYFSETREGVCIGNIHETVDNVACKGPYQIFNIDYTKYSGAGLGSTTYFSTITDTGIAMVDNYNVTAFNVAKYNGCYKVFLNPNRSVISLTGQPDAMPIEYPLKSADVRISSSWGLFDARLKGSTVSPTPLSGADLTKFQQMVAECDYMLAVRTENETKLTCWRNEFIDGTHNPYIENSITQSDTQVRNTLTYPDYWLLGANWCPATDTNSTHKWYVVTTNSDNKYSVQMSNTYTSSFEKVTANIDEDTEVYLKVNNDKWGSYVLNTISPDPPVPPTPTDSTGIPKLDLCLRGEL